MLSRCGIFCRLLRSPLDGFCDPMGDSGSSRVLIVLVSFRRLPLIGNRYRVASMRRGGSRDADARIPDACVPASLFKLSGPPACENTFVRCSNPASFSLALPTRLSGSRRWVGMRDETVVPIRLRGPLRDLHPCSGLPKDSRSRKFLRAICDAR